MGRLLKVLVVLVAAILVLPPLAARLGGWTDPQHDVLPPRGKLVDIGNGLSLNVYDIGQGSPVVLVHGLPSCAADWERVPGQLAEHGHRVISYDRVGYGYSSRPDPGPGLYTYTSNARELAALLDALGIEQAALVGWSYGGGVVQTLAVMSPQRVQKLVLVASVGPSYEPSPALFERIIRSPAGDFALEWVASIPPLAHAATRDALQQAFRPQAIPLGWVDYAQSMLALPHTLRSYAAESARSHESCLLPEAIAAPTLVVQGMDDDIVHLPVAQDLQKKIRESQLVLIPEAGHMLPVTNADFLVEQIDRWVKRSSD